VVEINVNGERHELDIEPDTPLLWAVREHLKLTGTKFGCGVGMCGACTMHLNGNAVRTCILPVVAAAGQEVRTIEGLVFEGGEHPVQAAWISEQVPQCGYCQSGQIMAAAALLEKNRQPTDEEIEQQMTNLCRCGTYQRIRQGILAAADQMPALPEPPPDEPEDGADSEDAEGGDGPVDASLQGGE